MTNLQRLLIAIIAALAQAPSALAQTQGQPMVTGCPMMGSSVMMWGMGLVGLLLVFVLALAAAALIKYLFLSKATA